MGTNIQEDRDDSSWRSIQIKRDKIGWKLVKFESSLLTKDQRRIVEIRRSNSISFRIYIKEIKFPQSWPLMWPDGHIRAADPQSKAADPRLG